jgi:uncharacterized Rmd1/YagE family protein
MSTTMASTSRAKENTPLLAKPTRVTFNPNPEIFNPKPLTSSGDTSSALNSKLRRRNSAGSPLLPITNSRGQAPKIGPQRTTKNAQKLKLLPNPDFGEDGPDEESGRDVYSQYTRIKDPTARRDAARLGKADRDRLPRVTAYCTASTYKMDGLMRFLKGRGKTKGANPKLFDECIYTPYNLGKPISDRALVVQSMPVQMRERRHSDSTIEVEDHKKQRRGDLIDLHTEGGDTSLSNGEHLETNRMHSGLVGRRIDEEVENIDLENNPDFDIIVHTPEVFLFNYGVVVIWGMTLKQEQRFLKEIEKFESEKLAPNDMETECFNFYYTKEYQARIYNDFITLREKNNYMSKLAISHALAQSVKVCLKSLLTTRANWIRLLFLKA